MLTWKDFDYLEKLITTSCDFLWGGPLLLLFFVVAIYQSWITKGIQFCHLGTAFKLVLGSTSTSGNASSQQQSHNAEPASTRGDISAFEALMTALAGAIGTGNITGIATAVATGGLGSLFWMWFMASLGMATAYSETVLSIKYRKENKCGSMSGGPMYYILKGLQMPKVAAFYAFFASIAALGIGCLVQSNSVVDAVADLYGWEQYRLILGVILAIFTGAVIVSGVKSIGRVAGILVPGMAIIYIFSGLFILGWNYDYVPDALRLIISSAFTGQAAVGGFAGSTILLAMQNGVQYGVFANEAGLGSLAIASASAKTNHAVEQGLRSVCGVFFATMVVCTLTGLVLAVTQVVGLENVNGVLIKGSPLAMAAFGSVFSGFRYVVVGGLVLFAFTTMLAWAYYGEKAFEYLLGIKAAIGYRWLFTLCVVLGAVLKIDFVWAISNFANVFMAIPNLLAIVALSGDVKQITTEYFKK